MTEAKSISDIVVGPDAIRVGAHHAGVGVTALLPGAVDVAVAEGVVLVLVLGVVLAGPDIVDSWGGFDSCDGNRWGGGGSSCLQQQRSASTVRKNLVIRRCGIRVALR